MFDNQRRLIAIQWLQITKIILIMSNYLNCFALSLSSSSSLIWKIKV